MATSVPIPPDAQVVGGASTAPAGSGPAVNPGAPSAGSVPQDAEIVNINQQPQSINGEATISATPQPKTWIGKFAKWMENVDNDIKYGTDETGIGTLLKKMGAHGVYAGNSEAVGDFMASLPLGLLKAGKGGTEVTPEALGGPRGKTMEGLEDIVSGGLQAATIPSAFVAPEAAEAAANGAGRATDAVTGATRGALTKAGEVAQEIRHGADIAQPGAQQAIRTATDAADGAKVIEGNKSVMDGIIERLDQMRRELYSQASEKAGFDVQQANEQLASARQRLKLTEGTEATDIADQAREQISTLEQRLSNLDDTDPQLSRAANQMHGKYAAALNFRKALVNATDVDGTVDVPKLLDASKKLRFTKWGDQLEAFMGQDKAEAYMQQLEQMRDMGAHAVKVQNLAKWVAKIAGLGTLVAGGAAVRGVTE